MFQTTQIETQSEQQGLTPLRAQRGAECTQRRQALLLGLSFNLSSETSQPFLEDVNGANIFLDLRSLILVPTIPGRFPLLSSTGLIDRIRHVESSLRSRPARFLVGLVQHLAFVDH